MYHIGIDSKPYWKSSSNSSNFNSSIASAIMITDYAHFQEKFIECFKIVMKKHGILTERIISKGFEIKKKGAGYYIILEFLKDLSKYIKRLYVYYTTFTVPNNEITINPKGNPENVTIYYFLRHHLDNYFPMVCYWDLSQKKKDIGGECNFYLDSFQGSNSNAWENIKHNTDFWVLPSGDKVNSLIAASDLFNHHITSNSKSL